MIVTQSSNIHDASKLRIDEQLAFASSESLCKKQATCINKLRPAPAHFLHRCSLLYGHPRGCINCSFTWIIRVTCTWVILLSYLRLLVLTAVSTTKTLVSCSTTVPLVITPMTYRECASSGVATSARFSVSATSLAPETSKTTFAIGGTWKAATWHSSTLVCIENKEKQIKKPKTKESNGVWK